MTVSNTTNRISAVGSGSTGQEVPFSFPITATSDLTVISRVTATGVETELTETTNYTVTINGDVGGVVTTVTTIETTEQIHIIRSIPRTQSLDLEQGGSFNAENVEDMGDKNTNLINQNADKIGRLLRFPETDPSASVVALPNSVDRAGKFLYFGAIDGEPTTADGTVATDVTVSPFMETVLDDADADAARNTLGGTAQFEADFYADFSTAISTIGATEGELHIRTTQAITTDETVPVTLALVFHKGGSLSISGTKTVTINGAIEAGLYEIFTLASAGNDIVVLGNRYGVNLFAEWWGAGTGESASTNATAIQAAINAAELIDGTVTGAPGTYETDTQLTMDDAASIWWLGGIIKQEDGANQTAVLKIDVASSKDVNLFIKVDGNMDNNAAIEGIVINGLRLSHGLINVTATECDTGIVVEGNTESNVMFLKTFNCDIGVLERAEGGNTPDENTLFVSGHANVTHYKKESADIQITSTLHFSCETSSGYAVILEGGNTIFNGILRGCDAGGIQVTSDEDEATIFLLFNNLRVMGAGDVGWGLIVDESSHINGSIIIEQFDGGVWIKKCSRGRLRIEARSSATLPAIRLGESGVSGASRFTVLPGSYAQATIGPALHLSQTSYCDINLQQVGAGSGNAIEFETAAVNDTVRINSRDVIGIEYNGTTDNTVIFYGGPDAEAVCNENQTVCNENEQVFNQPLREPV